MKCAKETTPEKPVTIFLEISKETGLEWKVAVVEYMRVAVLCLVFVQNKL